MRAANLVATSAARDLPTLDARYEPVARLGEGASATTYVAKDRTTGERRVVKLFAAGDGAAAAREARRLVELSHPSVVRVHDVGRAADGRAFVVTELVPGPPLESVAAILDEGERRRAFERAARELADALAYLHARGVVHGDVAAPNVRLDADGRAVLLDFGLSGAARAGAGAARGTLGYAAPEALVGVASAAGDLFGLGATLFEAWTGAAPFGRGLPAVQRMLTTRAPRLSAVRPGLPAAWDDLVAALLASEPERRPASARQLLRELARASGDAGDADLSVPYPAGDPLEGVFVGRAAERGALRGALERLAEGAGGTSAKAAIVVVGPPGSGRRTLIDVVARDVALAAAAGVTPALHVARGGLEALEALVGAPGPRGDEPDPARREHQRFAALAEAVERFAEARPLCVLLPEGAATDAFLSFWSGAAPTGRALVVAPARAPVDRPFAENVALAPLSAAAVRALVARAALGEEIPGAASDAVVEAAAGNAGLAAALARRVVLALRDGAFAGGALVAEALARPGADLAGVLEAGFAALPSEARRVVAAVALAGAAARDCAGLADAAFAEGHARARREGWVREALEAPALPSEAHRAVVAAALGRAPLDEVARRAAGVLGADDPRRAEALAAAGRGAEAAALWRRLAAATRDVALAADALERAAALDPTALGAAEELTRATGLGVRARHAEAEAALARADAAATTSDERGLVADRRAWLRVRAGDVAGAFEVLRAALTDATGSTAATLRARLGRLLVTSGRFRDALDAVAPLEADAAAPPLAFEAAILARAFLGETSAARAQLGRAPLEAGKRAYLEGLVAQLAGEGAAARAAYRRAYELSSASGDVHTLGAVSLNLGALLTEEGLFGEALAATDRAVRTLGRLGATTELGTALVNGANLLLQLGDLAGARRLLDRARDEAARRGGATVTALLAFVDGDLARREGRLEAAAASHARAAELFAAAGQPARAASATLTRAETLALAGQREAAAQALAAGRATRDPDDAETLAAAARLALAGGDAGEGAAALAPRAEAAARALAARGHRPGAWRLALLAARLFAHAAAPERAAAALVFARTTHEELRMATPEHHRAGLDADPDASWLTAATGPSTTSADVALAARAAETEARLRRLLRINKRLNSELRLPRLLETIVDTVIELCDAERGFLLLDDESGELAVKVARNIDQKTLETAEFELSRSIAKQAAAGGEPIVTIDAAGDARFKEAMSVSDLHLRSVLAVPLVVKGRATGTIYVDHRLRKGAFDQEDVKLVLDVADQAAIAIDNARLLAELRRRERQVEAVSRRLEVELAARREELSGLTVELRESREALAVRYDYRNIIGRTPRMLELFRLLDRVTDTALPVVIHGESGTGKELVARALHFNGPRKDRAFVSENCAAIPETLLESTLFGYVRGAFTGADRDARGLFEVADGGTLFLDEISEMSPAMQGKLLRVLQEGELRRVGAERTRKIDVRVVAATNRDLARLVEEGKFRQDLYFRLNVARISLPPLRERREDIPLIVDHVLTKCAAAAGAAKPKVIEAAAIARLAAYRWPGNVRELENEITRAYALSGERIGVADLAPAVASAEGIEPPADDADSLRLKPRVERLERSLLREALSRSGNNQTKAAQLLGLSRFGLQKKLKRYRFA
jgi:transcriptional regulator with GAF, ATPase, and Fis domain/tRNA A-37 threonylcarbamoyl transferase component Bud32